MRPRERIEVRVRTGRPETSLDGDVLSLRSRPEGGKANREAVAFLSKLFGNKVEMVSGARSRRKTFVIGEA